MRSIAVGVLEYGEGGRAQVAFGAAIQTFAEPHVRRPCHQPGYPDCTADGHRTVADFGCFQTRFVAGDPYADCNADGMPTVADFGCFQTRSVAGCP